MAQQSMNLPTVERATEEINEYIKTLDNVAPGLGVNVKMRYEVRNRRRANPDDGFRLHRNQAIQCVRDTIKVLGSLEVAIIYDNGQSIEKMNKYFLCDISQYFSNALDGSFKEASTRVIRLRHDFPWAVYAMLDFLKNGSYHMYPRLKEQYPHITMLDLHVHCYILADKYDIIALANCAAISYLRIAGDILSLEWYSDDPAYYDRTQEVPFVEYHPHDMCAAADVSRFLNSIVLLWRNTAGHQDPLRKQVLELIKACFIKLMRLKSFQFVLYRLEDFLLDLAQSFNEDDLQATVKVDPKKKEFGVSFGKG